MSNANANLKIGDTVTPLCVLTRMGTSDLYPVSDRMFPETTGTIVRTFTNVWDGETVYVIDIGNGREFYGRECDIRKTKATTKR